MEKFNMEVVKQNKTLGSKTIRIKPKKKGDTMSFKDIKKFYKIMMKKQALNPDEIQIVGLSPDKMRLLKTEDIKKGHITIKNMNDDIKDYDEDEYYRDIAQDPIKFEELFFVDFIIIPN
jgi:hypothetical protein